MCVIVYKPANADLPWREELKNCFTNNPHGAGFMTIENGIVIGRKGFMTFKSLWKALEGFPVNKPLVIHFRWATHGARDASATHPFPASKREKDLKTVIWSHVFGIAHNGIVPGYGTLTGGLSDPQDFIKRVLSDKSIIKNIHHPAVQRIIERMTASKWAILDGQGHVTLLGQFVRNRERKSDRCLYSNHDYEEYIPYHERWVCGGGGSQWYGHDYYRNAQTDIEPCPYIQGADCWSCGQAVLVDDMIYCSADMEPKDMREETP